MFRHLTPPEAAFLNGFSSKGRWGKEPRLAPSLIGQLASRLQAAWFFSSLPCFLCAHGLAKETELPQQCLCRMRSNLLLEAEELGLREVPATPSLEQVTDLDEASKAADDLPLPQAKAFKVEASQDGPAMQPALAACGPGELPWQLRDGFESRVTAGESLAFHAVNQGSQPPCGILSPVPSVVQAPELLAPCLPKVARLALMACQGGMLADDQTLHAMRCLAEGVPGQHGVLQPLLVLACVEHRDLLALRKLVVELDVWPDGGVVTAAPLRGHWIVFHWVPARGLIGAWCSFAPKEFDLDVAQVHWTFAKAAGKSPADFRFVPSPMRVPPAGKCGQFAQVHLEATLFDGPILAASQVLQRTEWFAQKFLQTLRGAYAVAPTCVAGGPNDLLERGLSATLKERGVPEEAVKGRASAALSALGPSRVQRAMHASAPWRELKALANQAVPAFQLVLPSELDKIKAVQVADGRAVLSKRKQKQLHPAFEVGPQDPHCCRVPLA